MKLIDSSYWGARYFDAKTRVQEHLPLAMKDIAHKFRNRHHSKNGAWYRQTTREQIAGVRRWVARNK